MRCPGVSIRVFFVPRVTITLWPTMLIDWEPGIRFIEIHRDSSGAERGDIAVDIGLA